MAICKLRASLFSPSLQLHPFFSSTLSSFSFSSVPFKRRPLPGDKALISAAISILKEHSESRWNRLRDLFLPHGGISPSQVSQIIVLLNNNPNMAFSFFRWTLASKTLTQERHTLLSYATMVHVLARCHLKSRAQRLLRRALRLKEPQPEPQPQSQKPSRSRSRSLAKPRDSEPDPFKPPPILKTLMDTYDTCNSAPYIYDILIRACLDSVQVKPAIGIFRVLRTGSRYYPLLSTCNTLIRSVVSHHGAQLGYATYREIFGLDGGPELGLGKNRVFPNVHTYNELLLGFYEDRMIDKMEELWAEMGVLRCSPNYYSYRVLLSAYCSGGKMEEAENLWNEMLMNGIKRDVVAFNTVIGGFSRIGDVERAKYLFGEMGRNEIRANCITYENLIYGYFKIGDVDSAMLLFEDMSKDGFKPRAFTIDKLIGELSAKKRLSEALDFFRVAMQDPDYIPKKSGKLMIEAFIGKGEMEEALKLREEMVGKGFPPSSGIYTALISAYSEEGNNEVVEMLRKEMLDNPLRRKDRKKREEKMLVLKMIGARPLKMIGANPL